MTGIGTIDITVVIPVKNEADNIVGLAREILSVFEGEKLTWECVWVDDGSTDGSLALLRELAAVDSRQRYLCFEKNAGQSAAFWAGFRAARADMIATIDGDGQNDPADIPKLLRLVMSGEADMANGYRAQRQDNFKRKVASKVANAFRNWATGKTVRDIGCSTRVFRKECVRSLPLFAGMHRFLPTLVALQGFRLAEIPVNHRPRVKGTSKYSINSRLWVGILDTFGVFWLKKRAFHYKIRHGSDSETGNESKGSN